MLVLTRSKNERIMIGDEIIITVVALRGDKVRLGITAPSSIPVHREEVYKAAKGKTGPKKPASPPLAEQITEIKAGEGQTVKLQKPQEATEE